MLAGAQLVRVAPLLSRTPYRRDVFCATRKTTLLPDYRWCLAAVGILGFNNEPCREQSHLRPRFCDGTEQRILDMTGRRAPTATSELAHFSPHLERIAGVPLVEQQDRGGEEQQAGHGQSSGTHGDLGPEAGGVAAYCRIPATAGSDDAVVV